MSKVTFKLLVEAIDFDFTMDNEEDVPTMDYQKQLTESTQTAWYVRVDAEDVDDEGVIGEALTDLITNTTGWCINAISYIFADS
jgi:hypothetical protein